MLRNSLGSEIFLLVSWKPDVQKEYVSMENVCIEIPYKPLFEQVTNLLPSL